MNRTLCMETNWKGNRTQKINKRDLAKHIVGFNEACENRSIVDYQIKLVPKTPHTLHLRSHISFRWIFLKRVELPETICFLFMHMYVSNG